MSRLALGVKNMENKNKTVINDWMQWLNSWAITITPGDRLGSSSSAMQLFCNTTLFRQTNTVCANGSGGGEAVNVSFETNLYCHVIIHWKPKGFTLISVQTFLFSPNITHSLLFSLLWYSYFVSDLIPELHYVSTPETNIQ